MTSRPVGRTRAPAKVHGAVKELVKLLDPILVLSHYPGNAKRHDLPEIVASLEANGQYKPIIAQRSTGHVLVGNGTLDAAIELGWSHIAVQYVDVDDDRARRINLVDNRLGELGGMDEEALLILLGAQAATVEGLRGSGFDNDYLADLEVLLRERGTGDAGDGPGMRSTPPIGDYAGRYAGATVRLLMCDYPNDLYVWLIDGLDKLRASADLDSNAAMIVRLVADATGTEPPDAT